jgi:hypothetical protein
MKGTLILFIFSIIIKEKNIKHINNKNEKKKKKKKKGKVIEKFIKF